MLTLKTTTKFKKDLKKMKTQGKDMINIHMEPELKYYSINFE